MTDQEIKEQIALYLERKNQVAQKNGKETHAQSPMEAALAKAIAR